MECYRRAMIGQQIFEGRRENLRPSEQALAPYATQLRNFVAEGEQLGSNLLRVFHSSPRVSNGNAFQGGDLDNPSRPRGDLFVILVLQAP